MHLPAVELHEASSLQEAAKLVEDYAPDAMILAGGTDVLVDLKTARGRIGHLVAVGPIEELRGMAHDEKGLRIGAMTTISELDRSSIVSQLYPVITDATSEMASPQVRNLATVGGNIAGAVPCADLPPVLMVLSASLSLWSPEGERKVSLDEFLVGPRQTILKTNELLLAVFVPKPQQRFGAAYERFTLRNGNGIAVAAVAAGLVLEPDDTVRSVHIALGAVAPTPRFVDSIGALLENRILNADALDEAAHAAREVADPISDVRGSAEFRRELIGVLAQRALIKATDRAKEASL